MLMLFDQLIAIESERRESILQGSDQQGTDLEISNKYFDNATWSACQIRKIITEQPLVRAVGGTCSYTMPGVSHANWQLNLI
jgi:hypothetical protein